jgi:hypothetical protein
MSTYQHVRIYARETYSASAFQSCCRNVLTRIMQRFDGYDEADGAIA